MKAVQQNSYITESSSCILNMLCVIDLSLILFNTSCRIYSIPKESKCTAVFLPINNETQCVPLLLLSSRSITESEYQNQLLDSDEFLWVLRVINLFQEALVTQFLGNYLLAVLLFFTKSYTRDRVRDGIIPGQLFEDCIGRYSDDYGRRTLVVSRSCEIVSQEKHFTVITVLVLGRASSRKI